MSEWFSPEHRIVELEVRIEKLERELGRLAEGCHVRKVHDEWPALHGLIQKGRRFWEKQS